MKPSTFRPASLAARLTITIGIVATVIFLVFGWLINQSIEHHFVQQDAGELAVLSKTVQKALATTPIEKDSERLHQRLVNILAGHEGMYLHISDKKGSAVFSSANIDFSAIVSTIPAAQNFDESTLQIWKIGQKSYRGVILQVSVDSHTSYTMIVVTAIDFHLHYLSHIHQKLWLLILISLLILLSLVWLAVYQGHAPLRRITEEIRQITTDQLHHRLTPDTVPAELAPLALSFNAMLGRIEEMVSRLSNFSADIAHELRTPVTSLMTQTQVSLASIRSIEEYREVLYSNLEEYEHMAQMIGDMLFLAQNENHLIGVNVSHIDLASEVKALFDYFEALADERKVTLKIVGTAQVTGDRQMLRRALSNIISNALKYSPEGETISIALDSDKRNQRVEITVSNSGPTIPMEAQAKIFDRFYRVDTSRQRNGDGAGLGLAIVKSIIDAHNGHINVTSKNENTTFSISLPSSVM